MDPLFAQLMQARQMIAAMVARVYRARTGFT